MTPVDRPRDQVLVLHRHHGDLDAGEPPELVRPDPGGVHHDLGLDRALVGDDAGHPAVPDGDLHHAHPRPDPRSASLGALGERHRQAGGIQMPVRRDELRPQHVRDVEQREPFERLGGRDDLDGQAEALGPSGLAGERLEPVRRGREVQRPHLVPPDVDAGLRLELGVQLDPVHHHPGVAHGVPQLGDQARRMERRPARELGAIQEQDVAPTELGEVVGDARPRDAAADDHDPGAIVLHVIWH